MGLDFYNSAQEKYLDDPLRSFHDGHLGSTLEQLIYLRNDDVTRWYGNVTVNYEVEGYNDLGQFGTTGWGIQFIYGERRPTEAEWDLVLPGEPVDLPDIGSNDLADTYTYHPIWVRVSCPGNEAAQIKENMTIVFEFDRKIVGAYE